MNPTVPFNVLYKTPYKTAYARLQQQMKVYLMNKNTTTVRAYQWGALALTLMTSAPASALVINPTYDASVAANFGANTAAFQNAFNYAATIIASNFSDNVTVNINVKGAAGTSILGQTSQSMYRFASGTNSYNPLYNLLAADSKTADDAASLAAGGSATAADPAGGNGTWWATSAQLKALGQFAGNNPASDGDITLGAGFTYAFDPNNRAVSGAYDIIGIMMHEITEIMGRIGLSGGTLGSLTSYTLLDAFSFKGPGVRGLGSDSGNWFSIDGGATLIKEFNGVSGGDTRDWASGTLDSFNAFSNSGVLNPLTSAGLRSTDVIGWDFIVTNNNNNNNVPEPSALGLFGLAAVGLAWRKRSKSTRA